MWYNEDEEEEDLLFSPALMARRASESWINTPPIEVTVSVITLKSVDFILESTNIQRCCAANISGVNFKTL